MYSPNPAADCKQDLMSFVNYNQHNMPNSITQSLIFNDSHNCYCCHAPLLVCAAKTGDLEIFELLFDYYSNSDTDFTKLYNYALTTAVNNGRVGVVEFFLDLPQKFGIDPCAFDMKNFEIAETLGTDMILLLLKRAVEKNFPAKIDMVEEFWNKHRRFR